MPGRCRLLRVSIIAATRTLKVMIRQRSAIKPVIGYMKRVGWPENLANCALGDAWHGVGHNIRLMLKKIHVCAVAL